MANLIRIINNEDFPDGGPAQNGRAEPNPPKNSLVISASPSKEADQKNPVRKHIGDISLVCLLISLVGICGWVLAQACGARGCS
jgi:hypothetical protein